MKKGERKKLVGRSVRGSMFRVKTLVWLGLGILLFVDRAAAARPQESPMGQEGHGPGSSPTGTGSAEGQALLTGTITGTVVDRTGGIVDGAWVRLSGDSQSTGQDAVSDENGRFSFAGIAPGPFRLTTAMEGFATQTYSGSLQPGENYLVPPIALVLIGGVTQVHVSLSRTDMAAAEIKDEEKQRVLGVVPNFYVTYDPVAVPLTAKQKFELAWKATMDPINFGLTAGIAGVEQATNSFGGYGQGSEGYARRYGASYAGLVTSTFIGNAMLPSLLKQDPRYFYKGSGGVRSRILYAIANSVICKGDNGRWQGNYSGLAGSLASGAISNLYYPGTDRNAAVVTSENTLIGIGYGAATNLLQEFVVRKLTPHAPTYAQSRP